MRDYKFWYASELDEYKDRGSFDVVIHTDMYATKEIARNALSIEGVDVVYDSAMDKAHYAFKVYTCVLYDPKAVYAELIGKLTERTVLVELAEEK